MTQQQEHDTKATCDRCGQRRPIMLASSPHWYECSYCYRGAEPPALDLSLKRAMTEGR
jgi:hypothetical protein